MNLYIVRHGYADGGSPDSERRLTEYGHNKLIEMMPTWQNYINNIDVILSSPYKRALETAKIIHNYYKVDSKLIADDALQPGINISDVIITLFALDYKNVMLVGHMPDVSDLVSELVSPILNGYPFSPGTLAAIKFNGQLQKGSGKLELLLPG